MEKRKLNVLGDSYSTPHCCVEPNDSFWGLAAKDLDCDNVVNFSHAGFSLDHIIHLLLNEYFDFENEYFLIGIPTLARLIVYEPHQNLSWSAQVFDKNFQMTEKIIDSLRDTDKLSLYRQFKEFKMEALRFDFAWHTIQSLEKIYLLYHYLKSKNAKFIIANLSQPLEYHNVYQAGKQIVDKVAGLDECIIFNNTYYSVNFEDQIKPEDFHPYGWAGHHGAPGNKNWYKKVIRKKMQDLGWLT
jgi:hypothetical protein